MVTARDTWGFAADFYSVYEMASCMQITADEINKP